MVLARTRRSGHSARSNGQEIRSCAVVSRGIHHPAGSPIAVPGRGESRRPARKPAGQPEPEPCLCPAICAGGRLLAGSCRVECAMPGGEPSDRLRLEYRTDDSVAIVDVDGEIGLFTCGLLRDRLLALVDEGTTALVL